MAALLIGLSVMAVMMSAALPVWTHVMQREREEELIWRGEQYKRAIGLFQRKYANTFPPTLDVLVEQKFLRKKYKDPVTDSDFQIIPVGGQARGPGMPGGLGSGFGLPAQGGQPGAQGQGQPAQGQQPQAGSFGAAMQGATQIGLGGQQQAAMGIQGVTSKSSDTSIKLYNGRNKYNEWAFIHVAMSNRPGGIGAAQPGQQVRPGMTGPNGQPMPGPGGTPFGTGGFGGRGGPPGFGQQQPGMQPGGFGTPPGGMQPPGFGTPPGPPGFGTPPGGGSPGPFQTPPGGGVFQPVNPGGPQPKYPPVPGGFGTPVKPPG
jgi:type II secretory pathway pseudopilin PulG